MIGLYVPTAFWFLVPLAYICGMFPGASLVARANGVEIRSVGSGNPGASNVTRTLGFRVGIWAFVLDAAKGAIPAAVGLWLGSREMGYILGAAAIVGHIFPATHSFRGGKGVATAGGVFAVMLPLVFVASVAIWALILKLTKTASIASIAMVLVVPCGVWLATHRWWEVCAALAIGVLVLVRHSSNIKRLASNAEHSISQ